MPAIIHHLLLNYLMQKPRLCAVTGNVEDYGAVDTIVDQLIRPQIHNKAGQCFSVNHLSPYGQTILRLVIPLYATHIDFDEENENTKRRSKSAFRIYYALLSRMARFIWVFLRSMVM